MLLGADRHRFATIVKLRELGLCSELEELARTIPPNGRLIDIHCKRVYQLPTFASMYSRVILCLLLVAVHVCYAIIYGGPEGRSAPQQTEGTEISAVSRSTLLKLLSNLEEHIRNRIRGGGRAVFTAQFANNPHTHRFVYPEAYNKLKRKT